MVMVATGGYEAVQACALQTAGLPVAGVNPCQARDFTKSVRRLVKTDTIDAHMLAEFASVRLRHDDLVRLRYRHPDPEQQALVTLVTHRWQLLTMAVVRPGIEAIIAAIRQQLDDVEVPLVRHVQTHFNDLGTRLRSPCGIGPVASATLIGELPELGKLNRHEIAPDRRRAHGQRLWQQRRPTQGPGRAFQNTAGALHGHADSCSPNPAIKGRWQASRGGAGGLLRQLLATLNTMVKTNKPWDKSPHSA